MLCGPPAAAVLLRLLALSLLVASAAVASPHITSSTQLGSSLWGSQEAPQGIQWQ